MLERDLEMMILDSINKEKGVLAVKYSNNAAFDPERGVRLNLHKFQLAGMSDIIALVSIGQNLYPLFLEVKTPVGRQSKLQEAFEKRIEKMGGCYRLVRSVEDAHGALKDFKRIVESRLEGEKYVRNESVQH